MTVIRSAMFDRNQKQLLRQAMISLICDLQRSFYADKKISEREYNEKFRQIDYPARSIWGFYNTKTKQYHAPINSKKVGAIVPVEKTSPYSAMQIKRIGLEQFM